MSIQIPKHERAGVLAVLMNAPPNDCLLRCNTIDRVEYWQAYRYLFTMLHAEMKSLFDGEQSPLQELDPSLKGYVYRLRDYYLSFYFLLREDWQKLSVEFSETLAAAGLTKHGRDIPAKPGEMLVLLIEMDSRWFFEGCFPETSGNAYRTYSPQKDYQFHRDWQQATKLENLTRELTKPEQRKVDSVKKQLSQLEPYRQGFKDVEQICLEICCKHAQRDKEVMRSLKNFGKAHTELWYFHYSQGHPNKGLRGFAWDRGVRLKSQKEGGTYS